MDQPHTSTGNRLCDTDLRVIMECAQGATSTTVDSLVTLTIGGGAVSVCSTLDSDNTSTVTEPTR